LIQVQGIATLPLLIKGVSCKFIINGIDGPNTSASNNPTSLLGATHFKAVARFTVKYTFIFII